MDASESHQYPLKIEKNESVWYTGLVLFVLIMALATLGNLMVLTATWMERSLRASENYFVASLAVADLLVGCLDTPFILYRHVSFPSVPSISVCRFNVYIDILLEAASINTLTAISIDRYLKISKPLWYRSAMKTSKSMVVIVVIWLFSAAYVTLAMLPPKKSPGIYVALTGCHHDNTGFFVFSAIFAFILPTFIMLIVYICILLVAHRRRKVGFPMQANKIIGTRSRLNCFYQDLKNIRVMAIVMGAFVLCWGPFFILQLLLIFNSQTIQNFLNKNGMVFVLLMRTFPLLNSVCNPIIYAFLHPKYREAFKRLPRKMLCA